MSLRRRVLFGVGAFALLLGLVVGVPRAWDAVRPLPEPTPGDPARGEQAFLSSDLGSTKYGFIPQVVFDALPELFPELFPEGWHGLGLVTDPKHPAGPPIGIVPGKVFGMDTYSTNCTICHVGVVAGEVVVGGTNPDFDVQLMTHTLEQCITSEAFTVAAIAAWAEKKGRPFALSDQLGVKVWRAAARALLAKRTQGWFHNELGPGRSDALNGWKRTLGVKDMSHVSWVDLPAVFNQRLKAKTLYDGSITGDPAARIMLTELQKGRPFRDPLLHREVFDDVWAFLSKKLAPPKFPRPVEQALVARGRELYEVECQKCHGNPANQVPSYPNRRFDPATVGTDPERSLAMTSELNDVLQTLEYKRFLVIEPTPAYMATALDGVWATAPYLHNGSVPSLWYLLQKAQQRPVTFVRRFNTFDFERVGLVCEEAPMQGGFACPPDAEQQKHAAQLLFTFDTRKPGNRNTGHEYGSGLPDDDKHALIEYLKTM